MQLKGLVKIFAIALILICLYQLSFTWFVHNHESNMEERADRWLKANFQTPQQKYAGNKELQALYQDTLNNLKRTHLQRLLDSTKKEKIVLWLGSYQGVNLRSGLTRRHECNNGGGPRWLD